MTKLHTSGHLGFRVYGQRPQDNSPYGVLEAGSSEASAMRISDLWLGVYLEGQVFQGEARCLPFEGVWYLF